jgi:hypothetical protein
MAGETGASIAGPVALAKLERTRIQVGCVAFPDTTR